MNALKLASQVHKDQYKTAVFRALRINEEVRAASLSEVQFDFIKYSSVS